MSASRANPFHDMRQPIGDEPEVDISQLNKLSGRAAQRRVRRRRTGTSVRAALPVHVHMSGNAAKVKSTARKSSSHPSASAKRASLFALSGKR